MKNWAVNPFKRKNAWAKFTWQRATEIEILNKYGKLQIFTEEEGPELGDIQQGDLKSCYFLSALNVLSRNPERIKQMFISDKVND